MNAASTTAPPEVVTLGECLVSLVASELGPLAEVSGFHRYVAGAEANVAVGLVRLGHRCGYIGRVGADAFGTAILRRLRGEGVDVSAIYVDAAAPTGLMIRELRAVGPAEVLYYRAGSAGSRLSPPDVDRAAERGLLAGARWLHLTGITPAISATAAAAVARAIECARVAGLTISLDLNLRRKLWSDEAAAPSLRELAAKVDVVLGSPDEVAVVTGRPATEEPLALAGALLALGPDIAVLKLGPGGALAIERGGSPVRRSALQVDRVVDPVGAGDAFVAGWIAARLDGEDLDTAIEAANACGAAAVGAEGDMTGLPTSDELNRLRATGADDTIR